MLKIIASALLISVLLAMPARLYAWGPNGHRITGWIAEQHLDPEVRSRLRELLGDVRLEQVVNWADDIRSEPAWNCAAPFHYSTVPAGKEYPEEALAANGDGLAAVVHYASVVADHSAPILDRRRAVYFLSHILPDLHQPLHIGLGCDRGGNDLGVQWFGEDVNLHRVWDQQLVETQQLSFSEYAGFLNPLDPDLVDRYQQASPQDWIAESRDNLSSVYRCFLRDGCPCYCGECNDGTSVFGGCAEISGCTLQVEGPARLGFQYRHQNRSRIETALAKAGTRLAAVINHALADTPGLPPSFHDLAQRLNQMGDWRKPFKGCGP